MLQNGLEPMCPLPLREKRGATRSGVMQSTDRYPTGETNKAHPRPWAALCGPHLHTSRLVEPFEGFLYNTSNGSVPALIYMRCR